MSQQGVVCLFAEDLPVTHQQIEQFHLEVSGIHDFGSFKAARDVPWVQMFRFSRVCEFHCRGDAGHVCTDEEWTAWDTCSARNKILRAAMSEATIVLYDKGSVAPVNRAWQEAVRQAYKQPPTAVPSDASQRERDQAPRRNRGYDELREPLLHKEQSKAAHWWRIICSCFR